MREKPQPMRGLKKGAVPQVTLGVPAGQLFSGPGTTGSPKKQRLRAPKGNAHAGQC